MLLVQVPEEASGCAMLERGNGTATSPMSNLKNGRNLEVVSARSKIEEVQFSVQRSRTYGLISRELVVYCTCTGSYDTWIGCIIVADQSFARLVRQGVDDPLLL